MQRTLRLRQIGKQAVVIAMVITFVLTGVGTGGVDLAIAREESVNITAQFSDTKGHWAAKEITAAAKSGLIQGFPDGTFRPEQSITQEQFLSLVARVIPPFAGYEPDDFVRQSYLDAVKGRWSEKTYTHLLAAGIMPTGKPTDTLNRLDAARLLLAAVGHQSEGEKYRGTKTRFFSDLPVTNESDVMAVYPAYKMGLMTGFPDGSFRPGDPINRAQAVVLLSRLGQQIDELYPGQVSESEKKAMTQAVSALIEDVMDKERIRRFDDLVSYVQKKKLPVSESFLREHFSFMKYDVSDYIRFPRFNELIYYARIGPGKYRMTVQYYSGELGGSVDRTFYLSSSDGKTFRLIGKDE